MKNKVIRLTEQDIETLVKKIIKEDMKKIMSLSKAALSPENQKIHDRLFQMFGVEPLFGATYAKNLKYIPYKYSGNPKDIIETFDLDLKKFDSYKAGQYMGSTNWLNLYSRSFDEMNNKDLYIDYSINIFIKEDGEVIFRFNSPDGKDIQEQQLKNSYTKDFKNSEEMFDFIESQNLTELLSQKTYHHELNKYKREVSSIQRKQDDDRYMSKVRNGYN